MIPCSYKLYILNCKMYIRITLKKDIKPKNNLEISKKTNKPTITTINLGTEK